MNNPLVSIIIPTYNRANLISETLDSIVAQTYDNWECIIVDDGSSDNTEEIVGRYVSNDNRFQYHKRPDTYKPGGNGARNYGFELSEGEYVNWFDSDDVMLKDFIKSKVRVLCNDSDLDVVFSAYNYFDNNGVQSRISNATFSGNIIDDLAFARVIFSPLSFMIKREVLMGYNFDENLRKAQDLDFFFKMFSSRPDLKIGYVSDVLHSVRKNHGEAISATNDKEGLRILSKHIVNTRLLNHFYHSKHNHGIERYRKQIFMDYKRMVEHKRFKMAIKYCLKSEILTAREKLSVVSLVGIHFLTGRGVYLLKKMA